ncbi:hypothetical protein [Oceanispirochaeta sp.]|jgi:hypothetical protein|uniref:hypothetical protein n=1 Tax=Oceanispirochaeta sp. TaxID=2035350 RepID=UPI002634884F|nr:hypothetical protein [Oceanispirochaeta sp.]MDA3955866.1 hypothetical protein [Oceanispirochaeta sp.]
MKMSPNMRKAQENMAAGVITADGFLGDDKRPIQDMIVETEELMRHHGIDIDDAVQILKNMMEEGRNGLGEPITVEDKWIVQTTEARGHLPCPFEDGIQRKITTVIRNISLNESIMISTLSLHLLKKHHFLEGKGSTFRLEPDKMKRVLELK